MGARRIAVGFAATGLVLLVVGCGVRGRSAEPVPVTEGAVTADDGTKLYYRKVGGGGPTVIVPGDFLLHDALRSLADGRTLVFYDMRNRGRSDSVTVDRVSLRADVSDLEAVRRELGAEQVDLVGFSYLGFMVAIYAKDHPDRVRRLIQLGPVPFSPDREYPPELRSDDYEAVMDSTALAELRSLQRSGYPYEHPREYCEKEWLVTRVTLVGDPRNAERLKGGCQYPNEWPTHLVSHFQAHFESIRGLGWTADSVAAVRAPVLTIHGTRDRNAPYGSGREWASLLPDARLVTVAGAAHCAWADDSAAVLGAMDTFLDGDWPASAQVVR